MQTSSGIWRAGSTPGTTIDSRRCFRVQAWQYLGAAASLRTDLPQYRDYYYEPSRNP